MNWVSYHFQVCLFFVINQGNCKVHISTKEWDELFTLSIHCVYDALRVWATDSGVARIFQQLGAKVCTHLHKCTGRVSFRGLKSLARIFFPLLARKSSGFVRILPDFFLPENGYLKNSGGGGGLQPPSAPWAVRLCTLRSKHYKRNTNMQEKFNHYRNHSSSLFVRPITPPLLPRIGGYLHDACSPSPDSSI